MWYSLIGFSVLEIVTEGLSLLSTCWCLGRFKGGNEASIDNASFGTLLSWFFRFSAGVEKGPIACWDGGNNAPSSASLTDVSRNACLEGKLYCREDRTRPEGTASSVHRTNFSELAFGEFTARSRIITICTFVCQLP